MMFILRADNVRDRWSGQVGLPGGRQEKGETDEMTVAREVFEEVGLILPELAVAAAAARKPQFRRVGRVHDRVVLQGTTRLVVACLVFMQEADSIALNLAPKEVAACAWMCVVFSSRRVLLTRHSPVSALLDDACASPLQLSMGKSMFGTNFPRLAAWARLMGVSKFLFTKVDLPPAPPGLFGPDGRGGAKPLEGDELARARPRFFVWGLTLSMVRARVRLCARALTHGAGERRAV